MSETFTPCVTSQALFPFSHLAPQQSTESKVLCIQETPDISCIMKRCTQNLQVEKACLCDGCIIGPERSTLGRNERWLLKMSLEGEPMFSNTKKSFHLCCLEIALNQFHINCSQCPVNIKCPHYSSTEHRHIQFPKK